MPAPHVAEQNLIIRYSDVMEEVTATEAARAFRTLLDRVEQGGATFRITRHGRTIAELRPLRPSTVGMLRARLRSDPPDADLLADIRFARELPADQPDA